MEQKPGRHGEGEHPIPFALGGSWTIDRVCQECDNRFGHTFDAMLAEVTKIEGHRELLALAGHSGRVPNALRKALRAPVEIVGAPHHRMIVRPNEDGTFASKTIPNIQFQITPDGNGGCSVQLNHENFAMGLMSEVESEALLHKKLKAALEEHKLRFDDETIRAAVRRIVSELEIVEIPVTVNVRQRTITGGYLPAVLKIAYEAAWYWLGDAWLSDPRAVLIRNHLNGDLNISVKGRVGEGSYLALEVSPLERDKAHVIYLAKLKTDQYIVGVQLFDLFAAEFIVTDAPQQYSGPCTTAIVMDAENRTYTEVALRDLQPSN